MKHLSNYLPGSITYKWMLLLILLAGCSPGPPAPVVNAWLEPQEQNSVYVVGKEDTLYSIAWQFGLDYPTLAKMNHLSPPYSVHPGQRLKMTNIARGERLPRLPLGPPAKVVVKRWVWPTQGKIIAVNAGIDIAGSEHSAVKAAQAGEVVYCGNGIR